MRRTSTRITGLALVLAVLATGCGFPGNGTYEVKATFPASFNLFPGSPVRVLGIEVGKIADVAISPDSDLVTVTMHVDDDIDVPADANAIVVPESLLGERFIQLEPPYTGGATLESGATIPVDRTTIPAEFDDVLEGLNRFVEGMDAEGLGRMFRNLADTLDGQGGELGETIDAAEAAIGVLRDNDEELVQLASRLADLNETLATRDRQMGEVIQDFAALSRVLADERVDIDRALSGLLSLSDELARLLETHREGLQEDLATITRVGRTAQRNLDQVSLLILSSAELYRHADRVVDREHNFLPLLNHFSQLDNEIARTVERRLGYLCQQAGLPDEVCADVLAQLDDIIDQICLPELLLCADQGSDEAEAGMAFSDALAEIVRQSPPELGEALVEQNRENDTGLADSLEELLRGSSDEETGTSAGLLSRLGGRP